MADKKISALTGATTPLDGTEVLPIVQGTATVKVANNDLRPKQIQSNATSGVLQVAGPGTAATRVMTTPDANFTAARTDAAQAFTGVQTFGSSPALVSASDIRVGFTNNGWSKSWLLGTDSNQFFLYNVTGSKVVWSADASDNVKINVGNLVQGTAAKGVNFTANTPAAGMTSQLLNAYEEGTWTPTLTGFTTTGTVTATGRYVLVGKILYLHAEINATGGSITSVAGTSSVRGQPYSAGSPSGLIAQNTNTGVGLGTGSYQGTYMYTPSFGPLTTIIVVDTTCRIN